MRHDEEKKITQLQFLVYSAATNKAETSPILNTTRFL